MPPRRPSHKRLRCGTPVNPNPTCFEAPWNPQAWACQVDAPGGRASVTVEQTSGWTVTDVASAESTTRARRRRMLRVLTPVFLARSSSPVADRARRTSTGVSARAGRADDHTVSEPETDAATVEGDGPIVDASLAEALVAVDGVTYQDADPPGPVAHEELKLPPQAPVARFAVESGGATIGYLTLVRAPDGVTPAEFEDDVVDRFFEGNVGIVRDTGATGDGTTFVVTNTFAPQWVALGDEFAMAAVNDIDDQTRWQWSWGDLLWIVEGSSATEPFAEDLVAAQHEISPPDDYDTHIIAGELNERFADLPAYWYWDQPRSVLLEGLDLEGHITAPCQDHWLPFFVTEGPERLLAPTRPSSSPWNWPCSATTAPGSRRTSAPCSSGFPAATPRPWAGSKPSSRRPMSPGSRTASPSWSG